MIGVVRCTVLIGVGAGSAVLALLGGDGATAPGLAGALLGGLIGLTFGLGGLLAWVRRPASRIGPLMIGVSAAWLVEHLLELSANPALFTVNLAITGLWGAVLAHLVLAYPSGHLGSTAERVLVGAFYGFATVWNLVVYAAVDTTQQGYPTNLLLIADAPDVAGAIETIDGLLTVVLVVPVVGLALRNRRRASRDERIMMGPVLAALAFIAAIALVRVTVALGLVEPARWMPLALEVGAAAVPIALVIGLLHARLLAVNDLATENERLRGELRSLQARRHRRPQPAPTAVVAAGLEQLSRREREVLTLVAEGWSNQAISDHLALSLKTIESHVRSVFIKLGLEPDEATHRRVLAARAQLGVGDGARRQAWTTNV